MRKYSEMIVPLIVKSTKDKLAITRNGKIEYIDLPFTPYMLAEEKSKTLKSTEIECYKIPGPEKIKAQRFEADSTLILKEKNLQLQLEGCHTNYLSYTDRLYSDMEDFILQYPNDNQIKIMHLDIEVLTIGNHVFPTADKYPIIAIGYSINNENVVILDDYNKDEKKIPDKKILEDFISAIQQEDPDILVTYNGEEFDFPYILTRMKKCELDTSKINRSSRRVLTIEDPNITGRIHFDLIRPARKDQSLFGIKSRSLKEVSKWYGHNALSLGDDVSNTRKLIGTQQLRDYLTSDIVATSITRSVYFPNMITLAETAKVALGSVIGCPPSFIPRIISSRKCHSLNLYPFDTNRERYGEVTEHRIKSKTSEGKNKYKKVERRDNGRYFTLGTKYEGALVGCEKTGYFPKIYKVDITGMYPSAIRTWNLGPDTTSFFEIKDLEDTDDYKFWREKNFMFLNIPDKNFKKLVTIKVDMSKNGFLKTEIERLTSERSLIKKKKSETKDINEMTLYDSQQMAIKIILNSIYGFNGSKHATYGDMATGLAITGMCRWVTKNITQLLKNKLIERDTDGFYTDSDVDVDELNGKINELTTTHQQCESKLILEKEEYLDAFFYKMKNYILRKEKKGKIVFDKHGVAFKSSRQCQLYDDVLNKVLQLTFDKKGNIEDSYREYLKLTKLKEYPLDAFRYRMTLSKNSEDYKSGKNSMQATLSNQVRDVMKMEPIKGLQLEYFVTKEPPVLASYSVSEKKKSHYVISDLVTSVDQLDLNYYIEALERIFTTFHWQTQPEQLSLF